MSKLNSMIRKGTVAVIIGAGLATAMVAIAQVGPGNGPGMMGHGGPGMMMGGHAAMFAGNNTDMAKFQQSRLGQLKTQLKITPEQQPAWDAFAAKASEQAIAMQKLHTDAATGTMPERMAQHQQAMGDRQKMMGPMIESVAKLYDVLTPEQRDIFDQSHGAMHGRG